MRKIILKETTDVGGTPVTASGDLKSFLSLCPEDSQGLSFVSMDNQEVLKKEFPGQGYMIIKPDFTFVKYNLDNTEKKENSRGRLAKCQAFTEKVTAPMGPDMAAAVNGLIAKDKTLMRIEDKGVREGIVTGTFVPVDLNTLNAESKKIFTVPNKYFLYRQKGIGGVVANVSPQIAKWLSDNNLTLDEPTGEKEDDIERWKTQRPLVVALQNIPGSAAFIPKIEGELGKKRNEINVYNINLQNLGGIKPLDKFNKLAGELDSQKIERQTCRSVVKSLSEMSQLFRKNPVLVQNINSTLLNKMTDYAMNCDLKKFLTGALGVGDEIARLKRDSSPFGLLNKVNTAQNQGNMNESVDDYLKSVLRKKLFVLSESKKKSVITTKEFKNYIRTIDEAFESLNSGKKRINEDGLKDMLSGALGYGGEGIISYFKEKLVKSIIDKFVPGGSKTWLGGVVSTTIGNIKIGDFLNGNVLKCEFLVPELAKGIGENAINQFADKKGLTGGFYDVLRNSVIEVVDDVPFVDSIQNGLSTVLCPTLGKLKGALGGLFGSLGSELKQEIIPSK